MYEIYCKLRDSQGLRDADVARITGITPSTFSDWKKGKSMPNAQKMVAIARALGSSVEYLMTGEGEAVYWRHRLERSSRHYREIDAEEQNLLYLWSQLSPDQRENVNALMNSFITQKRENERTEELYSHLLDATGTED